MTEGGGLTGRNCVNNRANLAHYSLKTKDMIDKAPVLWLNSLTEAYLTPSSGTGANQQLFLDLRKIC